MSQPTDTIKSKIESDIKFEAEGNPLGLNNSPSLPGAVPMHSEVVAPSKIALEAKHLKEYETIIGELRQKYGADNSGLNEIRKVHATNKTLRKIPNIFTHIQVIFVLSGRGSAKKNPVDHAVVDDPEDDYLRLLKGIKIAKKIHKATKGYYPPIFYAGRKKHNEELRAALKEGVFKKFLKSGDFQYPEELFIIGNINPDNTIGQAKSFRQFLQQNDYSTVALVSSGYHLARVARAFGNGSPLAMNTDVVLPPMPSKLEEAKLILFGIDLVMKRPGIAKDLLGEVDAMKNYAINRSIAASQPDNTYLNANDLLIQWSFRKQKEAAGLLCVSKGDLERHRWDSRWDYRLDDLKTSCLKLG